MMVKKRFDIILVNRGIVETRQKAKALIITKSVLVNGIICNKPGVKLYNDVNIKINYYNLKYVSRGGLKLDVALKNYLIIIKNKICLDIGASTGGFTDCLLKYGASKVFSLDVGYNQLSEKLRQNSKVVVIEKTNIRTINKNIITSKVDIVTIDVSFISVKIVIPYIMPFIEKNGIIIVLVKPQFEVGKGNVGKNGIVISSFLHNKVIKDLKIFFFSKNLLYSRIFESSLLGQKGNKEFFMLLKMK